MFDKDWTYSDDLFYLSAIEPPKIWNLEKNERGKMLS